MASNAVAKIGTPGNIVMEDAQIIFRNFAGREGQFNAEGDRNFCVLLDDDLAQQLEDDGWNVKRLRAREEGDTPQAYLPVGLKYRGRKGSQVRPPTTVMITSKGRTPLDEDTVEFLDQVDIQTVDLIIRPYVYDFNGRTGTKAYLQTIFVTIREDYLQLKYADVPEIGQLPSSDDVIDVESWEVDESQFALESGGE